MSVQTAEAPVTLGVPPVEPPAGRRAKRVKAESGASAPSWGGTAALLTIATVGVSLGNYVYSFIVVHLMSARDFSRFSGAQGLMLVLGSGCMAAIPWAMARFIAEGDDRRSKQEAIHFGLIASAVQGIAFAAVAGVVLWREAGIGVGVMVAVSAFVGSMIAVPVGFLQGVDRMKAITAIRCLEFVVRFASGIIILVVVSRSAAAALVGYPIGALVLCVAGFRLCRGGLPPRSGDGATIRALMRQSGSLGAIQVFLSMLGALDTVAALAAHLGTDRTASYQSAALLGRIPLFLSASIGLAAYVRVVTAGDDAEVRDRMAEAVRLYAIIVVPFVIVCLTVPDSLVHLLIPSKYGDAATLLRFTAISGAAVGWIDIVSTAHQARGRFSPAIRILGVAAVAQPIVLIIAGRTSGIWVFASALVAVSVIAAILLSVDARLWLPVRKTPMRAAVLLAGALLLGIVLHGMTPAWIAFTVLFAAGAIFALRTEMTQGAGQGDSERHDQPPTQETDMETSPHDAFVLEPEPPRPPRVLIIGDSFIAGLGVKGQGFGKMTAADLGAEAVLDLSATSKFVGMTLAEDVGRIRAFAPDLTILFVGGTEALVHPGPIVRDALERWGPPSLRGLTALEPRAVYSRNRQRALRQQIATSLKVMLKRILIRVTGGGPRIPLAEFEQDFHRLLALLEDVGSAMVFTSPPFIDGRNFPGTQESLDATQALIEATLVAHPRAAFVDIRYAPHYYDHFLRDNLHLSLDGHRAVANLVTEAAEDLLAAERSASALVVA